MSTKRGTPELDLDPRWVGRTYGDFLLRPQKGVASTRRSISLRSRFTTRLSLELPVVSANMDSVTEEEMAKTMALEGGLGIVHRAAAIERQAAMVRAVKRSQSAVIEKPLRVARGTTLESAKAYTKRHQVKAILVEESEGSGVLAGLLTNRDIPHSADPSTDQRLVDEFMTPFDRLHVASPGVSEEEAERIMFENRVERLPLVDADRRIRGLITLRDLQFLRDRPFSSRDDKARLLVGGAVGARGDYLERASALMEAGVDALVVDIAHGHSDVMASAIDALRKQHSALPLVCGNVATREGARFLAERKVDAVKVGVGPGRGCRTRLETAAGVPQLQAIREAWLGVGGNGQESIPIIADGGIADDKDIVLALIAGASSVMLGSVLSGTDESPGHVIEDPKSHEKRKIYRGMTSPSAVFQTHYDDNEERAAALETPSEGMEIQVPYKGSVLDVLGRIRGHLQSAVSYAGETSLAAARAKILPDPFRYLIPLTEASYRESFER